MKLLNIINLILTPLLIAQVLIHGGANLNGFDKFFVILWGFMFWITTLKDFVDRKQI
jgi:hypothetical protein